MKLFMNLRARLINYCNVIQECSYKLKIIIFSLDVIFNFQFLIVMNNDYDSEIIELYLQCNMNNI